MSRVKRTLLTASLCIVLHWTYAQSAFVSKIIEYKPAPGQFINTDAWGKPSRANSLIGGLNGGISLGGYGGYIVLGFDHRIENDPNNPYGIDFTVFGNPLATNGKVSWSEPGAVMVMKDENENGIADDTWYELAGSDYYFKSTVKNYQITYTNPKQPFGVNVPWTDNQGQSGYVLDNEFHDQPYYPLPSIFSNIGDELTFTGTKIKAYVDRSDPTLIMSYKRGFGYADNTPGGDGFDIDWAVDQGGNYVSLDGIDFIKIYTAVNEDAGWLGEVSTEVRGAVDVAPDTPIAGVLESVVLVDLPVTVQKGIEIELEAYAFTKGRIQNKTIIYKVSNTELAEIDNGKLITKKAGEVTVTASLADNSAIFDQLTIKIISPVSIDLNIATTSVRVNSKTPISASVPGIELTWTVSDENIISVISQEGQSMVQANAVGSSWLKVTAKNLPDLKDSVLITVLPEAETRSVYLTIKDEEGTIISRKKVTLKNFDLNPYVDPSSDKYGIDKVKGVTAAHAVAQLFKNESFESDLRFRDDGKLYLWRVPKSERSVVSYIYKPWLVKVNDRTYFNGLADVNISEGDEILVFHVADVSKSWQLIDLRIDKDTIEINEVVTVSARSYDQELNDDQSVSTIGSDAGKATFSFETAGLKKIQFFNESINVFVKGEIVTGIVDEIQPIAYPNPFTDIIHIPNGSYEILDVTGRILIKGNGDQIEVASLLPGIYILRLQSKTIKIIKK